MVLVCGYDSRMNTPAELPDGTARADVGLVCALAMELAPFFERCEKVRSIKGAGFRFRGGRLGAIRVAAVESGPGLKAAEAATRVLIDGHAPAWILACGFAGALGEGMAVGDIAVASSICTLKGQEIDTPHGMTSDPAGRLHVGRFVTTDAIVRTVAEKRALAARYDAMAAEMESYAVAAVCRTAGIPFMAVRAITDDLSADLPEEVHALLASSGARRLGAAVGSLWNRPESIKDMWKLRGTASTAAARLAPFLAGVVEQLHAATPSVRDTIGERGQ